MTPNRPTPEYDDRARIGHRLATSVENVSGPDDKALLTDAANWMSKFGRSHGALTEVLKVASEICDAETFEALNAAAQRGAGFSSN